MGEFSALDFDSMDVFGGTQKIRNWIPWLLSGYAELYCIQEVYCIQEGGAR